MEKEINKANSSEGTVEEALEQGNATIHIKHTRSLAMQKLLSKLRFWGFAVLFLIVFVAGISVGYSMKNEMAFSKTLKFMEQKKELTVEQFSADPFNSRDFAWDSENVPSFIASDFKKASLLKYDGVEYSFGENKIYINQEFMRDDLEVVVNMELGWTMSNFSIYSSGENLVIYGYWNDEFRRITLGKTENSVVKDVLTLHPSIAFSANSRYISEDVKEDYIFVISDDMRTVSAYHEKSIVGEAIVLPEEILGFYDGTMILTKFNDYADKLYVPYVIDNNGKEEFVCMEVATVTAEEIENVSDTEYMDILQSYTTRYSAIMGHACCYIFENEDGAIRMIVPNNIQKYSAYMIGKDILTVDDDLGWHWITIVE